MKSTKLLLVGLTLTLLLGLLTPLLIKADQLSVQFNKVCYDLGDIVELKVCYSSNTSLAIEVWGPSSNLVWLHEDPSFTAPCTKYYFKIPEGSPEGTYKAYIAIENGVPEVFTFKVYRPRFKIVSLYPTTIKGLPGSSFTLIVTVNNTGASGTVKLRLKRGTSIISEKLLSINTFSNTTVYIPLTLPSVSGTYTYVIETYNVKYGVVDDSKSVRVEVISPTVTIPPPPPPPVPITTTTTTTIPSYTPTTTKPVIPGGIESYVADLTNVTTPDGVVTKSVAIVIPKYNVKLELTPGTQMTYEGKPVRKLVVTVVSTAPPTPVTEKPVGTVIDIGPSGTKFSKPVKIQVPYTPVLTPPNAMVYLAYYDEVKKLWVPLPTLMIDRIRGVVVGETTHLTYFAAVAFRVVTPVATTVITTTTSTLPTTVTVPTTVITTTATPITTTVPSPVTITTTKTLAKTVTTALTTTTLKTLIKTKTRTLTTIATVTTLSPSVITKTLTTTVPKPVTPYWVYPVIAVLVVLIVIALIVSYIVWGRRRVTSPQA